MPEPRGGRPAPRPGPRAAAGAPVASPWQPGGREAQRALKRDAVLRTAAQLFNEKGYAASTLEEVAERLGVSKPTVYYYVDSKDAILYECVKTGLEMLQQAVREVDAAGGSAYQKLLAAMHAYVDIVTQDFGMCVIRVGEDPLPPAARQKLRRMKAGLDHEFRELIRQGIAEGSIADCDPKLAAFTLAGALSWIGRWYDPGGALDPAGIAAACIGVLTRGLAAPPAPAATGRRRAAR
ncbi:TetR/AcrR family transcriptional regulator [Piscinibacter sakaiensis]|uniref:Long-chain-fatty-acid--CoA ligase n=1 Tax=Piscinibacter sakaiensis TaxID=1547922 RepID=A0A0K8P7W5_PISS1|nr:TetR/AcrR family transcriptional regulator [Piscinibacter sakaiensis]GAP38717.1 long-chain-fatty-acid--CoA ligase [Piscinibacter sakaiensis]